ncbi:MAG: endonuclease/exonuclease/phosphatase family protein [Planctomycetota bacterium]|jgi:endonuclease/exonuclease/phosphatase family metal-dependent hydrolase
MKKKLFILSVVVLAAILFLVLGMPLLLRGDRVIQITGAASSQIKPGDVTSADADKGIFKLITLNMVHGRGQHPNRLLNDEETVRANLDAIAETIVQYDPDVVALQEADGPCFWSGEFDHVAYLSEASGLPHAIRGEHVGGMGLSYGTALLSRYPMKEYASFSFSIPPFALPKGFVSASLVCPWFSSEEITFISVHLDPMRQSVRRHQVNEMIQQIAEIEGPILIMGDMNCDWSKEPTLELLSEALNLHTHQPEASDIATFPSNGRRLDWIFISKHMEFETYEVLPDVLSDHLAVYASIKSR